MREEKAPNSVAEGCQFPNHIAEWKNKEYGNEICPVVKLQYSKMQKAGDKGRCGTWLNTRIIITRAQKRKA